MMLYSDSILMIIGVFQYSTTSDHFFTNCMFTFYKTEVMKVILRCLTGLNLEFLRYDSCFSSEVSKLPLAHYLDLNGHFTTIYGHIFPNYIDIFHKTETQAVILRYIVCLNLNWIKNCDILLA
jgi:hypothetical protein